MKTARRVIAVGAIGAVAIAAGCWRKSPPEPNPAETTATSASALPQAPSSGAGAPSSAPAASAAPATAPAVPEGYTTMTVRSVTPTAAGEAVLLVDAESKLGIPIFIGGTEALSIRVRMEKREFVRPLTHDLYDRTLQKLGGRVESVRVDKLLENTYHGTVVLLGNGGRSELDARPSDAIALALGAGAPIFVAKGVLERAGLRVDGSDDAERFLPLPTPDKRPDPITL